MDQGGENRNNKVKAIFSGKGIREVFAKIDVKYSNSMIEAFFRSIKNNYLYSKKFKSIRDFERSVRFYINEHNNRIPHNAFDFQTPNEVYFYSWTEEKSKNIMRTKEEAILTRKEANLKYQKCSICLV